MNIDVVQLPRDLRPDRLSGRCCVVFDVLRATTTMSAALSLGVAEIRLCESISAARLAAQTCNRPHLLCGEENCLPPAGFHLGNSPGQFNESHYGTTLLMATTNGTRALLAAKEAALVLAGALVNRSAVASILRRAGRDVTLLCAGTAGEPAPEDIVGAGAVIDALGDRATCTSEPALQALRLFQTSRDDLREFLTSTQGGKNILAAGLDGDIDFAARIDSVDAVGVLSAQPPAIRRYSQTIRA